LRSMVSIYAEIALKEIPFVYNAIHSVNITESHTPTPIFFICFITISINLTTSHAHTSYIMFLEKCQTGILLSLFG